MLKHAKHEAKFLAFISDAKIKEIIQKRWQALPAAATSLDKWNIFDEELTKLENIKQSQNIAKKDLSRHALYFSYLYPRIDANVSKGINHLLKSPFCVHPKTGKVCIPFDPTRVDKLDVNAVPTLTSVNNDINARMAKQTGAAKENEITIDCLEPYKMVFANFLKKVQQEAIERNKAQ